MRAPGLQPDEDERTAVFLAQHAVGKPCRARIRPGRVGDAGAPGGGVAAQLVLQHAGCLGRDALEHGEIVLFERMRLHLPGQQTVRHARAGEDHHAADRPVQPVNGADAAGLRLAEGAAQQLRHAAGLVGGQNARGLEADHDARVGIKQLHARPSCLR